MILTKNEIIEAYIRRDIIIEPELDLNRVGANSYDVLLSDVIYEFEDQVIDYTNPQQRKYKKLIIPKSGLWLEKGKFYLGVTTEIVGSNKYVPIMEGKSSLARDGMLIHYTAGFGDLGFINYWTLEISVHFNTKIVPYMPIAQIAFYETIGQITETYQSRDSSKYKEQNNEPQISKYENNLRNYESNN